MTPKIVSNRLFQQGFSLVELMVGVTIGLIAAVLMAQVVVFYDGQKRGTSSGADAQNTGAVALYTMESDIRQAGYGVVSLDTLACNMQTSRPFNGRPFYPLIIIPDGMAANNVNNLLGIPPGDAGSDIVVVMFSDAAASAEGVSVAGMSGTSTYSFGRNVTGENVGDYVMAAQAGQPCTVGRIAAPLGALSVTIDYPSTGAVYGANTARVFNLGQDGMTIRAYAVRGGNLTVCDFWSSDCAADLSGMTVAQQSARWVPIASNVVGLRAQYGWDVTAVADMRVDSYCRSRLTVAGPNCPVVDDGMTPPASMPVTACDFTRIASLRLALVTRGAEMATDTVNATGAVISLWPTVSGVAVVGPTTVGPAFSVPSQRHRYKVFNSTVPIRNVIWLGGQASCT